MKDKALHKEIIEDTAKLIKQAAHPAKRTLAVSPEVAAKLDTVGKPAQGMPRLEAADPDNPAVQELATLADTVSQCTKCSLCKTRTQTVFGDGHPAARLVFVGEAPGYEEDRQGKPFVGRAGHLLTDVIEKGMKIPRSEVFICNVLKCRPPNNRDPRPDEVEQCEPYLIRQLELIRPKVICALGAHAARTLLKTNLPIGKLRGKWHFYHGIPVRVTYHTAYLLRNPADKKKTWEDIKQVIKVYRGKEEPQPKPAEHEQHDLFS